MKMIPFSHFLQDARQGNYRNIFVKLQKCFFVAVIGKRMRYKNVIGLLQLPNSWLRTLVKLPTEQRMEIYLRSRKPRIDKYMKPIEMEHPGAVCVEFGELHGAKIKKASHLQGFFLMWRRWDSNPRPLDCQSSALANWATSPFIILLVGCLPLQKKPLIFRGVIWCLLIG